MVSRAPSSDSKGWMLVQLAHVLRRRRRCAEALEILELAVDARVSSPVEVAAYACAVAVHLDGGDRDTAAKVAGTARFRAAGASLLRPLGEAYLDLFRETGEPGLLDEAFSCLELAGLEDALAEN